MTDESFSVLIPDGQSDFALFVAHCLAPYRNVKIYVLSDERWAPIRFSRYCHTYIFEKSGPGDEAYLDFIAQLIKKYNIDVLLPTGARWMSFTTDHYEALSKFVALPPLPDPDSLAIANNKWLFAQFLKESEIPGPPTILVTCDEQFEKELQGMEFPVLIKPVEAMGGEGIKRFENSPALKEYLEQQELAAIKGRFIVQSLIIGPMSDANVLSSHGKMLAITMQRGIIPNVKKYEAAGAIRFFWEEEFSAVAHKLVSTLNWSGFANVDTLYDTKEKHFKILEINARFWGSLRGSLVASVSFPYLACLAALDIPFPKPAYRQNARYFHSKTALRESFLRLVGKNRESHFGLRETGWWFLMLDPVAECIRAFNQEIIQK